MNKLLTTTLALCSIQLFPFTHAAEETALPKMQDDIEIEKLILEKQAKVQIKTLGMALKSTLQHGMKASGAAASVSLCNIQAPAITQASSAEKNGTDWTVTRTSLNIRNPDNMPSSWIESLLHDFDERKKQGEDVSSISHSEVRDNQFYFVKAIPTEAGCVACHGGEVSSEVKAKLTELYPNDRATGYNIGEIRGAFIASKPYTSK